MSIWSRLVETFRASSPENPSTTLGNSASWLVEWAGGGATASGITVSAETAITISQVFSAVRILAEGVGSLPLHVYRRLSGGRKERAYDHPLYALLHDEPNPETTSVTFREALQGHAALRGNGYAFIERDGFGRPVAIWQQDPRQVTPVRVDKNLRYKHTQFSTLFDPSQILHVPGFGFDGNQGYSVVSLAREGFGLTKAIEQCGGKLFANGLRPSMVAQHPEQLSDRAYGRLKSSMSQEHGGVANMHKLMVLEEGMKIEKIGIDPDDAQFLDSRKFQVTDVARWFHIPPHMLADLDRATFSNIEQQALEFVKYSLRPWLVRWEQELNRKLFSATERGIYFVEFNVEGLLRGDIKARYDAYAMGRQWGWLSVNDIRERENMNPIEGGDEYLTPLNMVPVGENTPVGDDTNADT